MVNIFQDKKTLQVLKTHTPANTTQELLLKEASVTGSQSSSGVVINKEALFKRTTLMLVHILLMDNQVKSMVFLAKNTTQGWNR